MKSKVSSTLQTQTRRYASKGTEKSSLSRPITHLAKPACHVKNSSPRWRVLSRASVVNSATNTLPSGVTKPPHDSCLCLPSEGIETRFSIGDASSSWRARRLDRGHNTGGRSVGVEAQLP